MTHPGGLPRKLKLRERFVVRAMDLVSRFGYGVKTTFNEEYIRTYGVSEYFKWLGEGFRLTKVLEQRFGAAEGQMVIAMAGLWTGCRWCSTAHMLIANVTLFHADGTIGPIDELELFKWQELRDPEVMARLEQRLEGRWAPMAPVARRLYALRTGQAEPESDDDFLLVRANTMWEWLIECTIMGIDMEPASVPAWGPLGRDHELIARYRQARRERGATPEVR
jgi:hypothetical protein